MKGFFITGIGTDVGKTVVSAIVVEALQADYWKPIQCGNLDFTDSDFIEEYTLHHQTIHDEAYLFEDPVSPHLAACLSNKNIDNQFIKLPKSNNYFYLNVKKLARRFEVCGEGPIFGIIVPGNKNCKEIASYLQMYKLDVRAILSPTVPLGRERLRVVLHSFNTKDEIDRLFVLLLDYK